jgi:hypothetical protein
MGLRVRKSITICKGVRVNLGKTGASVSFGTKGLRQTIHTSGRRTTSIGIPGTGISYVTSSGGRKRQNQSGYSGGGYRSPSQIQRQQQKYTEFQQNSAMVQDYESLVNAIKTIHTICDDEIDWREVNARKEPFDPNGMGPRQASAIQALNNFRPNLIQKAVKSLAEKERASLAEAAERAVSEDRAEYEEWKNLNLLSKKVLAGDVDAYFQVINEMNPLDDLLEYGSEFVFSADDGTVMEVEFKVKSEQIVPKYSMSLTKTGKMSKKELTKTAYYDLVQDYVCSCAIRIARDMFALLPLKTVVVHAVDDIINTETGHQENATILSVVFERDVLNGLNFANIDPSDAMNNFIHNMKFLKTSGFKPVERITDY